MFKPVSVLFILILVPQKASLAFDSNKELPSAVLSASAAVFRIIVPDGHNFQTLSPEEYAPPGEGIWDSFDLRQKEFCREFPKLPCLYSPDHALGSAFLYKDQKTLVTALHNISGYLRVALLSSSKNLTPREQIEFLKGIKIPIQLQKSVPGELERVHYANLKNLMIKDSIVDFDSHKFDLLEATDIIRAESIDQAILELPQPIDITPLQPEPNPDSQRDIFVVGYPGVSKSQDGNNCWEQNTMTICWGEKKLPEFFQSQRLAGGKAEIVQGVSGGPFLSESGKVIGVATFVYYQFALGPILK
jgi:hypothetical protein